MSWIQLDDRILEHPKFVRAVRIGGSEAIHLWLGLRAYCAQFLSDGVVPADMLPEVRGPLNERKRQIALDALVEVGLLNRIEGAVILHDYLDWASSRDEVLARRGKDADRKRHGRKSTPGNGVQTDSARTPNGVTHPQGEERRGEDLEKGSGSGPDARKDPFAAQFGESGSAFAKVYAAYPNKAGRSAASTTFAELASRHPSGPDGLAADVLAAFASGMLRRRPYFNEKEGVSYLPFLERFLSERRWEDDTNPPTARAATADPNCPNWHADGKNTGRRNPRGQQAGCPECKSVYLREWTAETRQGEPTAVVDLIPGGQA